MFSTVPICCENCSRGRATIYCPSDSARLCLSCDRQIHAANNLSLRHHRTLLCDGCGREPANIRCHEERVSLCSACDAKVHARDGPKSQHARRTFGTFSGCPSASELARLWGCDKEASKQLSVPSVAESAIAAASLSSLAAEDRAGSLAGAAVKKNRGALGRAYAKPSLDPAALSCMGDAVSGSPSGSLQLERSASGGGVFQDMEGTSSDVDAVGAAQIAQASSTRKVVILPASSNILPRQKRNPSVPILVMGISGLHRKHGLICSIRRRV